ncbi:MAG: ribosome silencing factor [Bacteroidaceae bacterium]|nr:ribosome silencing factor [Bacteroidaceae bacterium]MBR5963185.1 ribosome silencing factor [Bacteroidaceae bacterium]
MNAETEKLVSIIVDAIQDKKGTGIVVADLSTVDGAVCPCFVICQGNTPIQVEAIARSVGDRLREGEHVKPIAVEGLRNARWVAIDYVDVMVHIFVPAERAFYNLENLWADAQLIQVPDLD